MMQTVAVTTADYARDASAKLRGIIAGRRDGVRYVNHPDEAADITAKAFNGNPTLYRRVFARYVAVHYWSEGKFDYDAMDLMVEGCRSSASRKVRWTGRRWSDSSFLPTDLQN